MGLACTSDKSQALLVHLQHSECNSLEEVHVLMDLEEHYRWEGQMGFDPKAPNSQEGPLFFDQQEPNSQDGEVRVALQRANSLDDQVCFPPVDLAPEEGNSPDDQVSFAPEGGNSPDDQHVLCPYALHCYILCRHTLRRREVIPVMIRYVLRRYALRRYILRQQKVIPMMSRYVLRLRGVSRWNICGNWTCVWYSRWGPHWSAPLRGSYQSLSMI